MVFLKHKAIRLLLELDKNEVKDFKRYLLQRSSDQKLSVRILAYYHKYAPITEKRAATFTFEKAYEKLIGKKIEPRGRKVFLNALSDLYLDLKQFLLYTALKEDSFEKDCLLLRIFQERKQEKEALRLIDSRLKHIKTKEPSNIWQGYQKMRFLHAAYFNNYEKEAKKSSQILEDTMLALDEFYTVSKLLLACEMENRSKVLPVDYQIPFLKNIVTELAPKTEKGQILITVYRLCLSMISQDNKENAKLIFELLKSASDKISKEDQLIVYTFINNFMVQELKKGQQSYRKDLFELYKTGIKNEIYIYQGILDSVVFANTINLASYFQAFDWARTFIRAYSPYLLPESREDSVHLSLANIAFAEKDYTLTLTQLSKVQFKDVFYALRSKSLILRSYYELKEDPQLILDYCKAFSSFTRDEQFFSKASLKNYLTLIKYVRIFLRVKGRPPKDVIIQNIENENNLFFQKWLIEKAEQLES